MLGMLIAVAFTKLAGVHAAVADGVGVFVEVLVSVAVLVAVAVLVGVAVFVDVGENNGVSVAVGAAPHTLIVIVSTRQPDDPELVSLPILHLRTMFCPLAAAGRSTVVVTNAPVVVPVHAARPAIGLLKPVEIVPV